MAARGVQAQYVVTLDAVDLLRLKASCGCHRPYNRVSDGFLRLLGTLNPAKKT